MSWRIRSNLAWLRELPAVQADEPLASRTSFGIGGPAEFFLELGERRPSPTRSRARGAFPYLLLGAGTNLLIADRVRGLVVRSSAASTRIVGTRVKAGAGLKMMPPARIVADANLRGFEFAIGVPGTVGGAVYQNAGCWGKEIREVLAEVEGFVPGTGKQTWKPAALQLGYRTSALREGDLHGALVVSATVQLTRGDGEEARQLMAKLTRERNETQPIKTKNCGSVFKNPPGDSAGRLVQAAGLKGAREGAAAVSTLHGNFIVNEGGATATYRSSAGVAEVNGASAWLRRGRDGGSLVKVPSSAEASPRARSRSARARRSRGVARPGSRRDSSISTRPRGTAARRRVWSSSTLHGRPGRRHGAGHARAAGTSLHGIWCAGIRALLDKARAGRS
jgi:UDP-N-acetylmuramate dehydrogenase